MSRISDRTLVLKTFSISLFVVMNFIEVNIKNYLRYKD